MITNARAYSIAQKKLKTLRDTLAATKAREPSARRTVAAAALSDQMKTIEADLRAYDQLSAAAGKTTLTGRFEDLGPLLAACRVARGWTQAQLAERLGLHMQQIQEYEARGYNRTSLDRLRQVLRVCGADVELTVRLIPFPAGVAEAITEAATRSPRRSTTTKA